MLGKVASIQVVENIQFDAHKYARYDGYKVTTTDHEYMVLIENSQNCCEDFGYITSEDNVEYYVSTDLLEVTLTDIALNTNKPQFSGDFYDCGGIQFVNFVTNHGTFQLAVYNSHNGYYGHSIRITMDATSLFNNYL